MDLIIELIKLIVRMSNSGQTRQPAAADPQRQMDMARQIQQRIEEARRRAGDPNAPMLARMPPPGTQVRGPQKQQKKQKRQAPPPLPTQKSAPVERVMAEVAPPPPPKPVAPSADAKLLARWLRPQTLRSQFILTEVFQPPLSMRE